MKKSSSIFMAVLAILTMLVVGCSVPAFPGSATQPPAAPVPQPSAPATGTIEVRVTDAPAGYEVTSIMVTIAEDGIQVHRAGSDNETEGEWITIPITGANPFDLKQLEDVEELLGSGNMTAGKYTQIRMDIEQVEVSYEKDGVPNTVNATLPSGTLKFVRPFEVVENETTVLLLDFDAEKSVIFAGAGRVMVKPVVKLMVSGKEKPIELEYSLEASGAATAELSTEEAYSGSESVHLETTGTEGTGDEARIVIPLPEGTTLGDIESISWREYLLQGYPPHVDIMLDFNSDDVADDSLVFEYAYNSEDHYADAPMPYGAVPDNWYQTFSDDGEGPAQVDDDANGWLASGLPGPPGDSNFIYGTLVEWKAGTVDASVDSTTVVLALEIEVDNWVVQSEAYVDDIEIVIDGVTYTIDM